MSKVNTPYIKVVLVTEDENGKEREQEVLESEVVTVNQNRDVIHSGNRLIPSHTSSGTIVLADDKGYVHFELNDDGKNS